MKKGVLVIASSLLLAGLTSAAYGYSTYNSFSLSDFLNTIDSTTMFLGVLFIVCFAFTNFALSKFFKDKEGNPNKAIAGVVGLAVSLLIVYWVNRSGFQFDYYFYEIGFSESLITTIASIAFPILFVFIGVKYGWGASLMITGLLIIVTGALSYEAYAAWIIGAILFFIGLWLWSLRRKRTHYLKH